MVLLRVGYRKQRVGNGFFVVGARSIRKTSSCGIYVGVWDFGARQMSYALLDLLTEPRPDEIHKAGIVAGMAEQVVGSKMGAY